MEKYNKIYSEDDLDKILYFKTSNGETEAEDDAMEDILALATIDDEYFDSSLTAAKIIHEESKYNDHDESLNNFNNANNSIDASILENDASQENDITYNLQKTQEFSDYKEITIPYVNTSSKLAWSIPDSISNLFELCRSNLSDFSFVYALSAQVCQEILPMECYVEFKMGLLLSLVSIQSEPLPIIGIGSDTSFASLLMIQAASLADRFVSSMEKFRSLALKNEENVEASPLLLAKGGVYYMGDWSRLAEREQYNIAKDISVGYVSVDNTAINYPLNSAIWCYWRNYKNNMKDIKTFGTLLKIFGIPFILEEKSREKLTDFLLEQAILPARILPDDDLSISFDDLKNYIQIVSRINVELPSECAELLKNYFVAVRYERPHCLTERAYRSLQQISESFAKLSFRNYVTPSDVSGAIYLSEHFLRNIFGPCVFPAPAITIGNDLEHVDNTLIDFQSWLRNYLLRFSSNIDKLSIK